MPPIPSNAIIAEKTPVDVQYAIENLLMFKYSYVCMQINENKEERTINFPQMEYLLNLPQVQPK
jgi:hypothetical protein